MTATALKPPPSYPAREMADTLADFERRLYRVERGMSTSGMKYTSIEATGINVYDASGTLRAVFGLQNDGTIATTSFNNPVPPPKPTPPSVEAVFSGASVTYDGTCEDGASLPKDHSHTNVYYRRTDSPDPLWTLGGTITAVPGTFIVAPLEFTTYSFRLTNVNLSGKESEPSEFGNATPNMVVGTDVLDGAITELKLAAEAVTAAAIKAGAVGQAQLGSGAVTLAKLADGSVSASKIIDGAVEMNKIAASAVGTDQLAANSVVAGKVATDAIEARHLIAGAVEAGKIAVDAVQAGNIVAGAITTDKILALAVTANEMAANSITSSKIQAGAITASKLVADMVVATRIIAGDPGGARAELHPTLGVQGYTAAGLRTFWLDSTTGNVSIIGQLQSGTGADRVVIQPGGDGYPSIFFYANTDPVKPAYMNAVNFGGRNALGLNSGPSADSGTTQYQGTLILQHDLIRLFVNTAPGNSRGINEYAGGYLGLNATVAELASFGQTTGVMSAQLIIASADSYIRAVRTTGADFSGVHVRPNEIALEINDTAGTARNGGFIWLRRGTAADTYIGHFVSGSTDSFIRFEGSSGDILLYTGNTQIRLNEGGNIEFYEGGSGYGSIAALKSFVIPHPIYHDKYLVHGCTESPHGGVEYWGEVLVEDGVGEVVLPEYFEALCAEEDRSVLLTQSDDADTEDEFVMVKAGRIRDGRFGVYCSEFGRFRFSWLVKAKRRNIDFMVEPRRDSVVVSGQGPYLTATPKKLGAGNA